MRKFCSALTKYTIEWWWCWWWLEKQLSWTIWEMDRNKHVALKKILEWHANVLYWNVWVKVCNINWYRITILFGSIRAGLNWTESMSSNCLYIEVKKKLAAEKISFPIIILIVFTSIDKTKIFNRSVQCQDQDQGQIIDLFPGRKLLNLAICCVWLVFFCFPI